MFFDAGHGGADQAADGIDRGKSRGSLRTATQTGSETGAFGRRRMRIKTHIFALRRPCRANWSAINVRRGNAYIKMAVKATIAGPHRAKTSIRIEFHGATLAPITAKYSPFSDLDIAVARRGLSLSDAPLGQRRLE